MGNIVILNQGDVVHFIIDKNAKLNKKASYKEEMYRKYLPRQKYDTNQNYKVISRMIKKELNLRGYSEITVWRVLKIYNTDKAFYKRIESGEPIKRVYCELFHIKEQKKKEVIKEVETKIVREVVTEINSLDDCYQFANKIKDYLTSLEPIEEIEEPMEKVRRELFFCSKAIQKKQSEIAQNRKWDPEEY